MWNAAGQVPRDLGQPGMPDLSCWVGAGPLPDAEQGLTVLGVPFGSAAFVNYLLRMLPPSVTAEYAGAHDSAVLSTFADFLGVDGLPDRARRIAQLPLLLGGLGLVSAAQTSVSAYWASWADCLPVLGQHLPPAAQAFLRDLEAPAPHVPCFWAAATTRAELSLADWTPPSWRELCDGVPAPTLQEDGPSTFVRGWQGAAASAVARRQCEQLLSTLDPSSEALLRSQQGPFASRFLTTVPTCPALSYPSHLFRVLLLRRLRLPLPLSQRYCRCRRPLDSLGDHRAACTRLADMNLQVDRVDDRRLEVVANGLPLWGGQQLAVDTTLVSPLSGSGQPCRRGGRVQGAALALARRRKERTYPELLRSERCRLVVLAVEVGGRWSDEAASFVRALARAKAREVPVRLRSSLVAVLVARWSALLSHAAMSAFAATFTQRAGALSHADGALPPLGELLADAGEAPLTASRLPAG